MPPLCRSRSFDHLRSLPAAGARTPRSLGRSPEGSWVCGSEDYLSRQPVPRREDLPRRRPWLDHGIKTLGVFVPGASERVARGCSGCRFEVEDEPHIPDRNRSAISVHDHQDPMPVANVSRPGAEAAEACAALSSKTRPVGSSGPVVSAMVANCTPAQPGESVSPTHRGRP